LPELPTRPRSLPASTRSGSSQHPLNYPIKLNNKIAALSGVIESADSKPTDQSYTVYNELTGELDKQLQRLNTTLRTELAQMNAALKREKLAPIDPNKKPEPPNSHHSAARR
jgi:hypothetical protein